MSETAAPANLEPHKKAPDTFLPPSRVSDDIEVEHAATQDQKDEFTAFEDGKLATTDEDREDHMIAGELNDSELWVMMYAEAQRRGDCLSKEKACLQRQLDHLQTQMHDLETLYHAARDEAEADVEQLRQKLMSWLQEFDFRLQAKMEELAKLKQQQIVTNAVKSLEQLQLDQSAEISAAPGRRSQVLTSTSGSSSSLSAAALHSISSEDSSSYCRRSVASAATLSTGGDSADGSEEGPATADVDAAAYPATLQSCSVVSQDPAVRAKKATGGTDSGCTSSSSSVKAAAHLSSPSKGSSRLLDAAVADAVATALQGLPTRPRAVAPAAGEAAGPNGGSITSSRRNNSRPSRQAVASAADAVAARSHSPAKSDRFVYSSAASDWSDGVQQDVMDYLPPPGFENLRPQKAGRPHIQESRSRPSQQQMSAVAAAPPGYRPVDEEAQRQRSYQQTGAAPDSPPAAHQRRGRKLGQSRLFQGAVARVVADRQHGEARVRRSAQLPAQPGYSTEAFKPDAF